MAREIGGWLSGDRLPPGSAAADPGGYPGQRLGLPEHGSGSPSRLGRRVGALCIDWFIAYGLGALSVSLGLMSVDYFRYHWSGAATVHLLWALLGVIGVRFFGFTAGQYMAGVRVASVDHRLHVGAGRALVRVALMTLVVPALIIDSDGRGVHDRVTATAVVRR